MRLNYIITAFLLFLAGLGKAQTYVAPSYPTGFYQFKNYVSKYVNYPQMAMQQGITGIVEATMYISKEGKVKLVKTSGENPDFNSEVKRVMRLSSNWQPALKNGIAIDTMLNLRVWFCLQGPNPKAAKDDIQVIIYAEPMSAEPVSSTNFQEMMTERRKTEESAKKLNEEGSALMKEKKFSEALIKFNLAIEHGGKKNVFLYNRGLAYLNLNDDEKAKEDFLEAARRGDADAFKIYIDLFNK